MNTDPSDYVFSYKRGSVRAEKLNMMKLVDSQMPPCCLVNILKYKALMNRNTHVKSGFSLKN